MWVELRSVNVACTSVPLSLLIPFFFSPPSLLFFILFAHLLPSSFLLSIFLLPPASFLCYLSPFSSSSLHSLLFILHHLFLRSILQAFFCFSLLSFIYVSCPLFFYFTLLCCFDCFLSFLFIAPSFCISPSLFLLFFVRLFFLFTFLFFISLFFSFPFLSYFLSLLFSFPFYDTYLVSVKAPNIVYLFSGCKASQPPQGGAAL